MDPNSAEQQLRAPQEPQKARGAFPHPTTSPVARWEVLGWLGYGTEVGGSGVQSLSQEKADIA